MIFLSLSKKSLQDKIQSEDSSLNRARPHCSLHYKEAGHFSVPHLCSILSTSGHLHMLKHWTPPTVLTLLQLKSQMSFSSFNSIKASQCSQDPLCGLYDFCEPQLTSLHPLSPVSQLSRMPLSPSNAPAFPLSLGFYACCSSAWKNLSVAIPYHLQDSPWMLIPQEGIHYLQILG